MRRKQEYTVLGKAQDRDKADEALRKARQLAPRRSFRLTAGDGDKREVLVKGTMKRDTWSRLKRLLGLE